MAVVLAAMLVPQSAAAAADIVRHPPLAGIAAPVGGSSYRDDTPVALHGEAADPDGDAGPAGMQWRVVRHTGAATEVVAEPQGQDASFTPSDRWGADTTYEVQLTVTDATGLSATTSVTIVPQTVKVTLRSEPEGAPLTFGTVTQAGDRVVEEVVGRRVALAAPETFTPATGPEVVLDGWSDGGNRSRDLVVPAAPLELVARYRAPQLAIGDAQIEVSAGGGNSGAVQMDSPLLPALAFDPPDPFTLRVLTGWLRRSSGTPQVELALRRGSSRTGCSWWAVRNLRFSAASRAGCGKPRFIAASMRLTKGGWRWRVALGRALPPGSYSFVIRVRDAAGRPISFERQ